MRNSWKNWYGRLYRNKSFQTVTHYRKSTSAAESGRYKNVIALNVLECVPKYTHYRYRRMWVGGSTFDASRSTGAAVKRGMWINTRQFVAINCLGWAGFYYFSDPFYHVATLRRTPSERATPIRLRRPSKRDKSASADIAADRRLPRASATLTFRGSPWANRRGIILWNIFRVEDTTVPGAFVVGERSPDSPSSQ